MSVAKLVAILAAYAPDVEVIGLWDGGYGEIVGVDYDANTRKVLLDVSSYKAFHE